MQETNEEFYRNRLNLCEHAGWRALMKDLEELKDLTNKLDSIESEKDLWFARGQLSILRQVTGLEEMTKLAMEELDF
jgi:hypothetical protein